MPFLISIRHLKTFIAVAETKKMKEAAEKLYISQPTVSQTISELEQYYNVKLFERYPKELYITKAGTDLLSCASQIVKAFDDLDEIMKNTGKNYPLRIGATLTVGSSILCQILDEVRRALPNIDVSVHVDNTKTIEQKLLRNELDAAIVEGIIDRKEILTTPIIKDCLVLICAKEHPFAQRNSVPLEELGKEAFILREDGSGTREMFVNFMYSHQIPLKIKWEVNSSSAIKQAVMQNFGLAVISARLVREELEREELCIVQVKDCLWKRFFYLCYHRNKAITEQLSCFNKIAASYSAYGIACPLEELLAD